MIAAMPEWAWGILGIVVGCIILIAFHATLYFVSKR